MASAPATSHRGRTVADLAGDAVSVLDAAGLERAHVIGASLGGMAAQELALAAPRRIDRLVLPARRLAPRAYPMPVRTVELMAEAQDSIRTSRSGASSRTCSGPPTSGSSRTSWPTAVRTCPSRVGALADAGIGFDAFDRVAGIQAPTLIVTATEDGHRRANSRLLAERIPGATVEVLDGCGHPSSGAAGAVRRARAGFLR